MIGEDLYGGDARDDLNTSTALCDLALPTAGPEYETDHTWAHGVLATSASVNSCGDEILKLTDNTIDQKTGLILSSRDASGVQTNYLHDELGRIQAVKPTGIASTTYNYELPTLSNDAIVPKLNVTRCPEGNNTCAADNSFGWRQFRYDGLARREEERFRLPGNVIQNRTISYNAVGWKLSETAWESTSSRTFWAAYDRFGRPGRITLPDGKITDLTYAGERLVTRKANVNLPLAPNVPATPEDLTPVYVTEYRDGFGRLVGVCEGASAAWSGDGCTMDNGLETIYRFDVTNKIDEVCHVSVGGTCGQYRRFNNDGRGFLMGERHPEVGTNGGGWTNYTFDSKGNPLTKDVPGTAAFDTSSTYDKAGRLIFLEETSGGRLLKEFAYGKANVGTNKSKGKLVTAKRHNRVDAVSPLFVLADSDVVVTEHFEYSAPGGRASRRQTRYSVDSTHHAFDASWTWDNLGNPKTITYPSCLGAGCSASAPSRTVTNTYDKGFLTGVTGFASLTYQGGGMVRTIAHTNGVTTTIARASHGMDRPASISTNAGWSTGNFTYDGVGNISNIGTISYQYDARSQLTSGGAKTAGGPYGRRPPLTTISAT